MKIQIGCAVGISSRLAATFLQESLHTGRMVRVNVYRDHYIMRAERARLCYRSIKFTCTVTIQIRSAVWISSRRAATFLQESLQTGRMVRVNVYRDHYFIFNDTATFEFYSLYLHGAIPI